MSDPVVTAPASGAPVPAPKVEPRPGNVVSPPAPQAKVAARMSSASNAAAAVKAMREAQAAQQMAKTGAAPIYKDGAPGSPQSGPDMKVLAAQAAAANGAAPVLPLAVAPAQPGATAAPAEAPKEAPKEAAPALSGVPSSTPPSTPRDKSWESLHAAEMKLMEERKRLEGEALRLKTMEAQAARADLLERELREKGPEVLSRYNWSPEAQARAILANANTPNMRTGATQGTATSNSGQQQGYPATAPAQGFVASPASGTFAQDTQSTEKAQLQSRVDQLENYILHQQVTSTLGRPEFDILRGEPDANVRVIREMNKHYSLTGKPLTFEEGAARVQDELVSAVRNRATDPRFAKVLGLNGSSTVPTPAQGTVQEKQAPASGGSEEPTTLTSGLAGSPMNNTFGRVQTERARNSRAAEAVRRARQSTVR